MNGSHALENRIFVIDKESGPTSFDVVRAFRRATGVKKVGHTGTLDPLARGVLLLCTGRATRAVEHFMDLEKEYDFDVKLGVATTTLDAEGERLECAECGPFAHEVLERTARTFVGTYRFRPPYFSAVHRGGKRLYELARAGKNVEAPERDVSIYSLAVLDYSHPVVTLRARCSRGTYVRSLAADYGSRLGVPAHVSGLTRRRVGPYELECAVSSRRLADGDTSMLEGIPIGEALSFLPVFILDRRAAQAMFQGKCPQSGDELRAAGHAAPGAAVRLVEPGGSLIAVGRRPAVATASNGQVVESFRLFASSGGDGR